MSKNDSNKGKRNNPANQSGQPEPLSGSKKVKNQNHTRAKGNPHHGL